MARISDAFATVLRLEREGCNARFLQARHQRPALSAEAFASFLAECADPVVCAVAAVAPDRTADTAAAAYDLGLELVAQNLAGPRARHDAVARAWQSLLTVAAALVAAAPRRVLGAVSNAVCLLAATPGVRPDWWREEMARLVPRLLVADGVEEFLRAGQIVAWRAGMAHFRAGALAALDALPEPLARAALGLPPDDAAALPGVPWAELRARLEADPWYVPGAGEGAAVPVARVGGFRGFGGLFPEPPQVTGGGAGRFYVRSGEGAWLLTADAFGATFHRATPEEAAGGARPAALPRGVSVDRDAAHLRRGRVPLPFCGEITACAANGSTLAITGSLSHAVLLIPLDAPASP